MLYIEAVESICLFNQFVLNFSILKYNILTLIEWLKRNLYDKAYQSKTKVNSKLL